MISKTFQNPLVVTLAAVIGLFAVAYQLYQALQNSPWRPRGHRAPAKEAQATPKQPAPIPEEFRLDVSQIAWPPQLARNPFQPAKILLSAAGLPVEPEKEKDVVEEAIPKLHAVWIQKGSRLAILDDQIVGEGATVDRWKVMVIRPDRVVMKGSRGEIDVLFASLAK